MYSARGEDGFAKPLYLMLLSEPGVAPYAHLRLSLSELRMGKIRSAVDHVLEAFRLRHNDALLLEMLSKLLLRLGEIKPALQCVGELCRLDPSPSALAEVGKMLSDYMLSDAALPVIRKAIAAGMKNNPAMQYLFGLNLMYVGDRERAELALESSLAGNPDFAPAHWALTKVGSEARRSLRIDRLRALVRGADGGRQDLSLLWYSLFHELDRDGQTVDAWNALSQAAALRRAQVPYDESKQVALFASVLNQLQKIDKIDGKGEESGPAPVFIVGLPRTGTTVIDRVFCEKADAISAGELRDLPMQMRWLSGVSGSMSVDARLIDTVGLDQAIQLGARYLGHTQWRAEGHPFYTDKWPENYYLIAHILTGLPAARVIFVRRSAEDACFSNFKEWFASSYLYSYDQREVARQYVRYANLIKHVSGVGSDRVAVVDYEGFVKDPDGVISSVMHGLDIPCRSRPLAERAIPTASTIQVRSDVTAKYVGAWSVYEKFLTPMLDELESAGARDGK